MDNVKTTSSPQVGFSPAGENNYPINKVVSIGSFSVTFSNLEEDIANAVTTLKERRKQIEKTKDILVNNVIPKVVISNAKTNIKNGDFFHNYKQLNKVYQKIKQEWAFYKTNDLVDIENPNLPAESIGEVKTNYVADYIKNAIAFDLDSQDTQLQYALVSVLQEYALAKE